MVNLLGVEPSAPSVMQPGLFFHWYGKTLKPLRKLGHINLRASTRQQLDAQLAALLVAVYGEK